MASERILRDQAETKSAKETETEADEIFEKMDEEVQVVGWRRSVLLRAGYSNNAAVVLGLCPSNEVDLHAACCLLEKGCSEELALQILL